MTEKRHVRLRTAASDKAKAFAQYNELRLSGRVKASVIIAELKDGSWQILGQHMGPEEMARALMVAAEGLTGVTAQQNAIKAEAHEEPLSVSGTSGSSMKTKAITKDADGTLVPPYGENIVSCGECHHPRWYVLHTNADDVMSRMACAHCGNEVIQVPIEL